METTVKERLIYFIKISGLTQGKFCSIVGLSRNYVSNIVRSISDDKLSMIEEKFPNLNTTWLMSGQGSMLKNPEQNAPEEIETAPTVKERLMQFLKYKRLSQAKFSEMIGVSRSYIPSIVKSVSPEVLDSISESFPDLSKIWLLTGEGPMLKDNETSYHGSKEVEQRGIPLVSETVAAGFGNEFFEIEEKDVKDYYVVPEFRNADVDFMIKVTGTSMYPHFMPGDIIACSILHNTNFIQWNKPHVIATRDQGLIVKRVMPSEKDDCIKAVSDNKEYPPFDIPKVEITGLAIVVGSINIE